MGVYLVTLTKVDYVLHATTEKVETLPFHTELKICTAETTAGKIQHCIMVGPHKRRGTQAVCPQVLSDLIPDLHLTLHVGSPILRTRILLVSILSTAAQATP